MCFRDLTIFFQFLEEKVEEDEEDDEEQSENEPSFSVNPDTPVGHDYVRQVSFISVSYFWENLGNRGEWAIACIDLTFFSIPQVVMFYCDLCHKYLPKLNRGDPDELIDTHCVSTSHQDAYVKKQIEEQEALKALAEVIYLFR